jgi:hypothetical protein
MANKFWKRKLLHVAVPFLLNNKIKFAITLTVADESEDKGG